MEGLTLLTPPSTGSRGIQCWSSLNYISWSRKTRK